MQLDLVERQSRGIPVDPFEVALATDPLACRHMADGVTVSGDSPGQLRLEWMAREVVKNDVHQGFDRLNVGRMGITREQFRQYLEGQTRKETP